MIVNLVTYQFLRMIIKNELKEFYNQESKKYHQTRKKFRSDGKRILEEIKKNKSKKISILEFGCGSGRLISFLNSNIIDKKIDYIGVDISQKLLDYAQKENPKNKFICDDIINYITKNKQETFDFIIWIASLQHIPTYKENVFLMKNFYKTLKYNWKLIIINRSFSRRFILKYFKYILSSIIKTIYTFGTHNRRNLNIPRKNDKKIYNRFYHIFSKKEIWLIWKMSWFKVKQLIYIDRSGQKTNNRKKSKNTLFIWEKNIS